MRIVDLLASLREQSIELRAEGEQLHVLGPKGVVTSAIAATIRERKSEILRFLVQGHPSTAARGRIPKLSPGDPRPLSSGQQRLWYLDQLEPGSCEYNMPLALDLVGALDATALRAALSSLIERHEALRTTFRVGPHGEPEPHVARATAAEVPMSDLSNEEDPAERERRCAELLRAWSRESFDVAAGPLVRSRLIKLGANAHVLFFMPHHLIYDGVSHEIFQREFLAAYVAKRDGVALDLPQLPITFTDYAAWQQSATTSPETRAHIEYWASELAGTLPTLELPTKGPRPSERTINGDTVELQLDEGTIAALGSLGREHAATLFMVLFAGFAALLSRLTGQRDLIVGTPVANRPAEETWNLIGFFANTLAVRVKLEQDPTFIELLQSVRKTCLGAYIHQEAPFDQVVADIRPPRDRSRTALFQCMFSLDEQHTAGTTPSATSDGSLAIAGHRPCGTGASRTDLSMWLRRGTDGIAGTIEFNRDLFEIEYVQQVADSFVTLLKSALGAPNARLLDLALLDAPAESRLLAELNPRPTPFAEHRLLHEWFEEQAQRTPEAPALTVGTETLTFEELDARANQLAHALVGLGASPGAIVSVCLERSHELVVGLLGILKTGAAYLPLDARQPKDRLARLVEDSGAQYALVQASTDDLIPSSPSRVHVDRDRDQLLALPRTPLGRRAASGDLAYLIYTSGSTGAPKAVLVEHRNTANFLHAMQEPLRGGSVWLSDTTVSFDISVLELFGALGYGFHVILSRGRATESLPALIGQHEVTHFQCTPSQASMLVADEEGRGALGRLAALFVGGEALTPALLGRLKESVRGRVHNMYGPTETTVWSTMATLDQVDDPVPIGRPLANTSIYVLDQRRRLTPSGTVGEIYIAGAGVARGYHRRPELTAERFLPDPFAGGSARMYRTGDLGRHRADGSLEYRGRTDFQVKLRGHRIELGEIEATLAECPGVKEAVVVLHSDSTGDDYLIAYLSTGGGEPLDLAAIKVRIASTLPEIMRPTRFVSLAAFPLTISGKIDRHALPKPTAVEQPRNRLHVPARTRTEQAIAATWSEVLGSPGVGLTDNFFDLGGHSLLAVKMVRKLHLDYGIELSLGAVFASPNLEELARRAGSERVTEDPFLLPLREGGENPPLFCICGLNLYAPLADALGEGQPVYGVFVPAENRVFRRDFDDDQLPGVPELASEYIRAIRTRQPNGPYCIAGVSFGGVLAFEVAQQLVQADEEVRVLALFDAVLPRGMRRVTSKRVLDHLRRFARDGFGHVLERIGNSRGNKVGNSGGAPGADRDLEELQEIRERIYMKAMEEYEREIKPYPGDLVIFRAADQSDFIGLVVDPLLGWSGLQRRILLHEIDGTHLGMLAKPYVATLAKTLRPYLDRARDDSSPMASVRPNRTLEPNHD